MTLYISFSTGSKPFSSASFLSRPVFPTSRSNVLVITLPATPLNSALPPDEGTESGGGSDEGTESGGGSDGEGA